MVMYTDSSKTYEFFEDQGQLNVYVYSDTPDQSFLIRIVMEHWLTKR